MDAQMSSVEQVMQENPPSSANSLNSHQTIEQPPPVTPKFFNRESSWLAFNSRVLDEAASNHNPLLERVGFLAIADNNLDEFFMKRVGGLRQQYNANVKTLSIDGRTPLDQLNEIRSIVFTMMERERDLFFEVLLPKLEAANIRILPWKDLNDIQRKTLEEYFENNVFPTLTPLGRGPGQPFPFLSNLSLSLAVLLCAKNEEHSRFARVKIPTNCKRWVQIPNEEGVFVALEEVIAANIHSLFPGMQILETVAFRITRNADVESNEEEADDLIDAIEEELRNRRSASIVRLEIADNVSEELLIKLVTEIGIDPQLDVYKTDAPLALNSLFEIKALDFPKLRFSPFAGKTPLRLKNIKEESNINIFSVLRQGDLLVHHPFQSFSTTVLKLLEEAASDPKVLAIKQTLYRTATNSPIVASLLKAVENGKEVSVLIEIKARFDEAANIGWVRKVEHAGVHVTYGFVGLKTHCKTMLIVREEPDGIRRYAHIGTGNYHPGTAKQYTDLGLLTSDPEICQDIADLFNSLTGHSLFKDYRKMLVAPYNMRLRFLEMIYREIEHQKNGQMGHIIAKMNSLEDPDLISALYTASQAGVKIDLIVRGFCSLVPGVPGLSENIKVISIIGRFLEHSRIYYFRNADHPEYYIGSADWMTRNLDSRVEAIVPILSQPLQKQLDFIFKTTWNDHRQSWELYPDGHYERRKPRRGKGCQQVFMDVDG